MRKKLYLFPLFLAALCISLSSCLNDDDDDEQIDQEWKALNEKRVSEIASSGGYNALTSQSGNGNVYWKRSDVITKSDEETRIRVTTAGKPEFTDTVVVRYEGWYLDKDNEIVIFDSTENPSVKSKLDYRHGVSTTEDPNKQSVTMPVNGITNWTYPQNKLIDGWVTLLEDMTEGEEREVVIPHQLGYGSSGSPHTPATGYTYTLIDPYTTLWFRIKLLKIIPMKSLED